MGAERVPVLEVGGTHVSAALIDATDWSILPDTLSRRPLDGQGSAAALIDAFLGAARTLDAGTGARWGVAMPGPFDYDQGIALFEDVGKFDSLRGVDVRATLCAGISPRPASVSFLNDADAFLLGEWLHGAATGYQRCAAVTLGTGIGSGFLADGEIVGSGPDVPPGGRAHRLYIDGRPLEDGVSRRAIRAAYRAASGDAAADVREIAEHARGGDPVARDVIDSAMKLLGTALAPYLHRFGAEVVVIGGSMSASWDLFGPAFTAQLRSPIAVVVAQDPEHAPLLGAGRYALTSSRSECVDGLSDQAIS
ncbi:MAG TPA: ROK family protein [Jatrophihabitantaceae bacterium]|jgi:glucokinase